MTTADLAASLPAAPEPLAPRPFGPVAALAIVIGIFVVSIATTIVVAFAGVALLAPDAFEPLLKQLSSSPSTGDSKSERIAWIVMLFSQLMVVLCIVGVVALRGGRRFCALLALNFDVPKRLFWTGLWITLALIVVGTALEELHPPLKDFVEAYISLPADRTALWISFVVVVVGAPVSEELLFRGFLYTSLRARWSAATTLIVTSILFSLSHFEETGLYALLVLPMAFLLGCLRERSGGIALPIAMHALTNLAAMLISVYRAA